MSGGRKDPLRNAVERHSRHLAQAERERHNLLRYSVFLGTVAGLFILPVVAGAYLGLWIDRRLPGYSIFWSMTLIVLGIAVGVFNVYFYLRDRL